MAYRVYWNSNEGHERTSYFNHFFFVRVILWAHKRWNPTGTIIVTELEN